MINMEAMILEAKAEFQEILEYIQGEAQNQEIHEVEKGILRRLLELGLKLLIGYLKIKGDGNVGEIHTDNHGVTRPAHSTKKKMTYFSIFGKVVIERAYYWLKGQGGLCPLDAELNLPESSYSYALEEWATLLGARGAYNKVRDVFKTILQLDLWNEPVKAMMGNASEHAEKFYEQQPAPDLESEGPILVATVDGKGVPIKKQGEPDSRKRLKKGEKRGKKKMSTVTAVYTIDKHERTVDEVVQEVLETDRALNEQREVEGPETKPERPKPKNKVVRATLEGKQVAFDNLAQEIEKRDPCETMERVALMDGERKLRDLAKLCLSGFCIILDLYHVLEYLWNAAHVFHLEGSEEASSWVTQRLKLLLRGGVDCIIANLTYELEHRDLSASKRDSLKKVICYLDHGKEYMQYHIYLARGLPIGSGVVEGACRNLVKDRMEQTGMRWSIEGAESVLQMRSVDVNGKWQDFWEFRAQEEHDRLYQSYGELTEPPQRMAA